MKKIVFTGGGSAGHVTPNLAIIPKLNQEGWKIDYIGSETGIEKQIIESYRGVPYHPIPTGKLRRYFDLKNFKDPFNVLKGVFQAYRILRKLKPDIVFSKGGFVSVPVVFGSWLNRIPVIIHESDMTPGLANKLSIPFATKVCVTFPETMRHITDGKAVHTGSPIRQEILKGSAEKGYSLCGFQKDKPVLMMMGGSLGSQKLNQALRNNLDSLLDRFQIVHICGTGHLDGSLENIKHYKQFEYLNEGLADILAITDVVVSRAGANSLFEFLSLRKPMLLIPLSKHASRGDQILNAQSFQKMGYSNVLLEEHMNDERFYEAICETYEKRNEYTSQMNKSDLNDSVSTIAALIEQTARRK